MIQSGYQGNPIITTSTTETTMLRRQGDVFIQTIHELPADARLEPLPHGVLVHGEVTGHSHRIENLETAALFAGRMPGESYMEVTGLARIVHEEHGAIELPPGTYRIWRQREYSPEAIRHVVD
jgi:hypothetical protein